MSFKTYRSIPNIYIKPWSPEYTYVCPRIRCTEESSNTSWTEADQEAEDKSLEDDNYIPYEWREEHG